MDRDGDDDVFVKQASDSDYDPDEENEVAFATRLEPFRSVVKNQIRSKMSDEVMSRTINLVLCVVDREDMAVSASGIAKFRKKVEQETLDEFENAELGHVCLKMDGKDQYFCFK